MGQTKAQLREEVRRNLGHPFVKVELCDAHIDDAINRARDMWIKWAVGNATQEVWFTLMLRDGQWIYDLPTGVTEVLKYRDEFSGSLAGSNHTFTGGGPQMLFSLDNAMYMQGFMNPWSGYNGMFNLVDWVTVNMSLGDLDHYHTNRFNWIYHRYTNQLELRPTVPCESNTLTITTSANGDWRIYDNIDCTTLATTATTFNSPGFVLLRTFMLEGSTLPTYTPPLTGVTVNSIFQINDGYSEYIFSEVWIKEYVTALCKITLGHIRRKFASFSSLGNQGIALDGSELISEGTEEKNRLEEELDLKHSYEGYDIIIG